MDNTLGYTGDTVSLVFEFWLSLYNVLFTLLSVVAILILLKGYVDVLNQNHIKGYKAPINNIEWLTLIPLLYSAYLYIMGNTNSYVLVPLLTLAHILYWLSSFERCKELYKISKIQKLSESYIVVTILFISIHYLMQ